METTSPQEITLEPLQIRQAYARLRVTDEKAVAAMTRSLTRHGQLTPTVVTRIGEHYEMVDGFKRLRAARAAGLQTLRCTCPVLSPSAAKLAIYGLHHGTTGLMELEEAWIVQALHREEKMSQVQIATALGHHKSWVCRRLALAEKLVPEAQDQIRVGLLRPWAGQLLAALPRRNQTQLLSAIVDQELTSREVTRIVELWKRAASPEIRDGILASPTGALAADIQRTRPDQRLTPAGQQAANRIRLLQNVGRATHRFMEEGWEAEPLAREILGPPLTHLAATMGELTERIRARLSSG